MLVRLVLLPLLGIKDILLGVIPNLMHLINPFTPFSLIDSQALRRFWLFLVKRHTRLEALLNHER
jgi:hypothetical protein